MAGPNYLLSMASTLKRTLDKIKVDKEKAGALKLNKYCNIRGMTDAWHDDLDVAGPGLASLKAEGQEISLSSIQEGVKWRYIAQTYAIKCAASRELLEDNKYQKAIDMQFFNRDAIMMTCEYLAASMLINRDDSNYLGGDGVILGSASHPVTRGGTFSNVLSTPAGPSTSAISQVVQNLLVMPGRDGLIRSIKPQKVVFPADQWGAWRVILESEKDPVAGNFSAINIARGNEWSLTPVLVEYWQGAANDWAVITDVGDGLTWRWRRRPMSESHVDNNLLVTNFQYHMRVAYGWSDPRGIFFGGSA